MFAVLDPTLADALAAGLVFVALVVGRWVRRWEREGV